MNHMKKAVSWLELFYDLAFVALIAQFTYLIAEHHTTVTDFINIFIVGYSIFIAWWGTTVNRNLQASENNTDKLLVQGQMIGAFLMSLTMPAVFAGSYVGYFLILALVRFSQVYMLNRLHRIHPDIAPATNNVLQGIFIAGVLWAVSAFTPDPYHYIIAMSALVLDIFAAQTKGKGNKIRLLDVDHLQERLGLFLMLVIGESMIVIALSNTSKYLSMFEPPIVLAGLGTMIALWWIYFDFFKRYTGVRPYKLFYLLHAHCFLFGSVVLVSVGFKLLLSDKEFDTSLIFIVLGYLGMAITLGIIWLMYYKSQSKLPGR